MSGSGTSSGVDTDSSDAHYSAMFVLLALAYGNYSKASDVQIGELNAYNYSLRSSVDGQVWSRLRYKQAFADLPELNELMTTPFMVQIVMKIIHGLVTQLSTPAVVKSDLIVLVGSEVARRNVRSKIRSNIRSNVV